MDNKKVNFEAVLRTHSLTSEEDSHTLWEFISQTSDFDQLNLKEKEERFMTRFEEEKSFGMLLEEAMNNNQLDIHSLCQHLSMPVTILEKIIQFTSLPHTIPIKKMMLLLTLLHIPREKAARSIQSSLRQFTVNRSGSNAPVFSMRQSKKFPFHISNATQSKESLKRDIDIYVQRLLKEGVEHE